MDMYTSNYKSASKEQDNKRNTNNTKKEVPGSLIGKWKNKLGSLKKKESCVDDAITKKRPAPVKYRVEDEITKKNHLLIQPQK